MKKVIFVQTPYQFITSLYLKQQFSTDNDEVDLIVADTFNNYDVVCEKIRKKKIFTNVYTLKIKNKLLPKVKTKKFDFEYTINNLKKVYYILFPKQVIKKFLGKINRYDEIYSANYDLFLSTLRSYYAIRRHFPKIFLYEDAYFSYFPIDDMYPIRNFMKINEIKNKILGLSKVNRNNINGWILFEPKNLIYNPKCPVHKIDRTFGTKVEFKELVDYIFEASQNVKKYDKKFIIFEEALIANDPNIDDEKIFDQIIDIVGKENVIIKLHPRTNRDRFSKKGIKTLGSDGVPWEAMTCVGDFSNKIFITISSSSVINYKMFFGNQMKGYLLFKFLKLRLKQFDNKYNTFWKKVGTTTDKGGICIPETAEEFYEKLNQDMRSD